MADVINTQSRLFMAEIILKIKLGGTKVSQLLYNFGQHIWQLLLARLQVVNLEENTLLDVIMDQFNVSSGLPVVETLLGDVEWRLGILIVKGLNS